MAGLWLGICAIALCLEPLSASEADLLHGTRHSATSLNSSPLGGVLLILVLLGGPPLEIVLRFAGLAGVAVASLAAFALARRALRTGSSSAPDRRDARFGAFLAAACVLSHGTILATSTSLSPGTLLMGALGALVLVALRLDEGPSLGALAGVAAASLVAIVIEPLSALIPLAVSVELYVRRRSLEASTLWAVVGATLLGLYVSGLPVLPQYHGVSFEGLALRAVALGAGAEGVPAVHPLLVVAAPAVALSLLAIAVAGMLQSPWPARALALGLTAAGSAMATTCPRGELDSAVAVLLLPVLTLGAVRFARISRRGPDGVLLLLLLLGTSTLSGGQVLSATHHEEARAAAASIHPSERPETTSLGLDRAIEFYRDAHESRDGSRVRVYRRGDDSPRLVAVHAFGEALGRLWLIRPAAPVYDLGENLREARVSYREEGRTAPCPWDPDTGRFFCGGPEYQYVAQSGARFDGVEHQAIYLHPLDDGVLEVTWSQVPLGARLVGVAGLDDSSLEYSNATVRVEARVTGARPLVFERGGERGLFPFEILLGEGAPDRGDVTFLISAENDKGRHLFLDALVVP